MKRERHLTKRERKDKFGRGPTGTPPTRGTAQTPAAMQPGAHIHCVACGRHLDTVGAVQARAAAGRLDELWATVTCQHGSQFYACFNCVAPARVILDEHDRTGREVKMATPWH